MLGIINQRIHSFLEHAFFIADDYIRCTQLNQTLQAVVAVDHPAIEVVEVGGGKAAAVQLDHRTQVRRDHRQNGQNHPFRFVC